MYTLIITFYIALLGIIGMILLKRREFATGKPSLVSVIGRGTDNAFQTVISGAKRTVAMFNKRTLIIIAQWLAFHILLRVRRVYVEIKHRALNNPHAKNVLLAVRGRGEVRKHGASFFLRKISREEERLEIRG